jgi:3-oxoacyl-[acyl-carrier-protein] synthase-3
MQAAIQCVAYHLPEERLDNDALASIYPGWSAEKIHEKTGVRHRHIAREDETAADLAFIAADRLLRDNAVDRESIDYLLFCTQEPDYFLPSSSCLLQQRLGLPKSCGAIDVNQGCSGYVYSLGVAKGLIESGQARNVLVLTGDTYSKLIHPLDKSVRTLFGDAGTATLLSESDSSTPLLGPFVYGTDGSNADRLIVPVGGFRRRSTPDSSVESSDGSGNTRSPEHLYMDGPDVLTFALREVPRLYKTLLERSGMDVASVDYFVFHQGSKLMLDMLRKKLHIDEAKFVLDMEETGNTVSSTLPVALARLAGRQPSKSGRRIMLLGFGVGYSWAGTIATF